ncbi:portal protein [Microbacterium phage Honk]|uniref:Portal protein n=1 Tax=Microbacterium phage Honk TaxID=2836095 RepID=A0A8F3E5I0_9CAUD|nr:portal protein [Microbacterium phage Honk]
MAVTTKLAAELDEKLRHDLGRDERLGLPRRYLRGDHDLPYMPRKVKPEYKALAEKSRPNWLPLVVDEFAKGLTVDGYRRPRADDNVAAWRYWQDNGLDARQDIAHRGALEYGTSYVLVLPGADKSRPVIKPLSPLRSAAWYADPDDDFPELGYELLGTFKEGEQKRQRVAVYTATERVIFSRPVEGGDMRHEATEEHGLGVVPFVRFRDRLDGESLGLVRPFKTHQDRINDIAFAIAMAIQYASFRQRWATGLAIPEDDEGNPVEPFDAAVDRLWISEDGEARFGDFAQTDISGHQVEYKSAVATLAAAAQIDADLFAGNMTNVTGEALLARRHKTNRKTDSFKLLFGEAWELVFKLAARAAGEPEPEAEAEVRWRDTSGEDMLAKVDALGKLAQMLNVPAEALWEEVPGVTDSKLKRWRELADAAGQDALTLLTAELQRQAAANEATAPPVPEAPAEVV